MNGGASPPPAPPRIICIGASAGGPMALRAVLAGLTGASAAAVVVAQHMPRTFTRAFAARLDGLSPLQVEEARDGAALRAGHAYVAPGGAHLRLRRDGAALCCAVTAAAPADRYVPSIDALFAAAAAHYGAATVAAVLTGMGDDGSDGARAVHAAGGRVLAEAAASATYYGMPERAHRTGAVAALLPLPALTAQLAYFARGG